MFRNISNISDLTHDEIRNILNIQSDKFSMNGKCIGLLFEKCSTRTRLSFEVGILQLNGKPINIRMEDLNYNRSETFEDTFRAMNCYLDGLVYRTNDHRKLIQASRFFTKPIINALSDVSHPCQILSDLLTLQERFGSLDCHVLWMGDMNNVCFSLFEAAKLIPELKLTICTPHSISSQKDWKLNSNIEVLNKLDDINLPSVNCVMTDVFISMNDEDSSEKIDLLRPYMVNSDLMSKTAHDCVFMHCLPAKVGFEVSEEVFRSSQSIVWKQAYNRMVAQKKLLKFIYQ